jgi:hypothetical protein
MLKLIKLEGLVGRILVVVKTKKIKNLLLSLWIETKINLNWGAKSIINSVIMIDYIEYSHTTVQESQMN